MTYRQLAALIQKFNEEQLDSDVTIWDIHDEEYYSIVDVSFADEATNDVLDHGHPYLVP